MIAEDIWLNCLAQLDQSQELLRQKLKYINFITFPAKLCLLSNKLKRAKSMRSTPFHYVDTI